MSTPGYALHIEHWLYLTDRPYRRALHVALRRIQRKRRQERVLVVHEDDGSCCAREAWAETALRLQRALAADGSRAAWVLPGAGGVTLIAPPDEEQPPW